MAEYKLIGQDGVHRKSDNAFIPIAEGNRDYQEFKEWLAEGNTPDPEFTPEELAQQEINEEMNTIHSDLNRNSRVLFKMLVAVFKVGREKGLWTKADFEAEDPNLVDTISVLRNRIQRLEEIE